MEPIRIVLVDDHALMREGTRNILEQNVELKIVGEANDGEEGLEIICRVLPDIAILDIHLPKLSGIEILRRMKDCSPNTKALMFTAFDDDDYVLALMEAGANGYLLKSAKPNELIDAVYRVNNEETVLDPVIAGKVAVYWAQSRDASKQVPGTKLSTREIEVLEFAAKGLRNKIIADRLCISVRTVEGHLSSIFSKLGVSSRMEAVFYAISQGLITIDKGDQE
jgi:DNA-binding NarL/FixJ family response regulator